MTTIAYDAESGVIAADSQETGCGGDKYSCKKLFRVNSAIIATAGGTYAGQLFVNWYSQWEDEPDWDAWDDHPDLVNLDVDEDFECLVLRDDGSCFSINRLFVPVDQKGNRFVTLGSGGSAARGAMMAGATPKEAVEIAKKIDSYTGGKVVVMKHG